MLRLILGQGLVLTAAGLVLGLAAAVAATRLLTTMLFEVRPIDTQVYLGVIVLLGVVTRVAGYLRKLAAVTQFPRACCIIAADVTHDEDAADSSARQIELARYLAR